MAAAVRSFGCSRVFPVIASLLRSSKDTGCCYFKSVCAQTQFSTSCVQFSLTEQAADPNWEFSSKQLEAVLKEQHEDMPDTTLANPYQKPHKKCIICQYNVPLDFKNTKLLSQFVSPHTGQIYGAEITGLCIPMQKRISKLIRRARRFGFMPYLNKEKNYLADPKLFNPFKRR